MLRRSILLLLSIGLSACASLRQPVARPAALAIAPVVEESVLMLPHRELACIEHPMIDRWERRIRGTPSLWRSTLYTIERGAPYLDRIREVVSEAGLPPGLALLPAIESGFRMRALGPRRSRGIWQLQTVTARRFGLTVSRRYDERLDVESATRAALAYLALLHDRYDDWPLALAAYNCGEGRVDRALKGLPGATFWDLVARRRLPPITRDYVPKFLAVVRVVDDADAPCLMTAQATAPVMSAARD